MQRGGAIQHHRVALSHLFQHVPNLRGLALDKFLGRTYGVHVAKFLEPANNEWLEQHERHLLGQAALVKLQLWPNNDHRTTGVIYTFAEQVLAETTALTLKHVGQRFERAVTRASHSPAVTAVVKQRVHGLL